MATLEKIKEESNKVRHEVREKSVSYIVGGFGLVAGLAWNDAVRSTIEHVFPNNSGNSLMLKFMYALSVTVIVVVVSIYLLRLV